MHLIKIFNYRQKSEEGFILIAAIMAVMIMLAVSFFILTTSTKDILISSRLVGERKALSAAESGAETIYASSLLDINSLLAYSISNVQVDPTNDPSISYTVSNTQNTFKQAPVGGGGQCTGCTSFIYNTDITGTDSNYGSSVTISIGMAPPSTMSGPNIPPPD
jgi:hypothetical protein